VKKVELYEDGIGAVEYVEHMGSDLTIVNSARVSFGKHKETLDEKDEKLIKYLVNHKHTSTFEHNVVTFRFVVPLFIRSQHHRHRTWSYNEISRRYTDFDLRFYEPKEFRTQHKSNRQASNLSDLINPDMSMGTEANFSASYMVESHHKQSLHIYNRLIEEGVCREQARGVLPQNLYTEYYGTCNLSNLLKFIELRTHTGAQWEIQQVANACMDIAESLWPTAVGTYRKSRK
jgi:thymidylate synthase (FAD)|tara:strand:- start:7080 stop:7775 length:696 start_codon:yes stop_codon:yes gene_type:complete